MSKLRPRYNDSDSENEIEHILSQKNHREHNHDEDDFSSLSFAALSSAQEKLRTQNDKSKTRNSEPKYEPRKKYSRVVDWESESDSDSDSEPESYGSNEHSDRLSESSSNFKSKSKSKSTASKKKHAPSESSSKKPVSAIREITGLSQSKGTSLYKDIRFDSAYGRADLSRVRKDYAFLDEYREKEVADMKKILKDKKTVLKMSDYRTEKMKFKLQSLQSRLDTLKSRDLANKIISDHKKEQLKLTRTGQQTNPYFLKKSEQRKMIQKVKFDTMKASQREKVMERKRKKRLGKEFKQLEFRHQEQ